MALSLPTTMLRTLILLLLASAFVFPLALRVQGADPMPEGNSDAKARWIRELPTLLQSTSSIIYGTVVAAQSRWDEDHQLIVTDYTVTVIEPLLCTDQSATVSGTTVSSNCLGTKAIISTPGSRSQFMLETAGGFLEAEGLGLWVSHEPSLAVDSEVLLLLTEDSGGLQIRGGEWGVYTVAAGLVQNASGGLELPSAQFLQILHHELGKMGRQLTNLAAAQSTIAAHALARTPVPSAATARQSPHGDDDPPRWLTSGVELDVKVNLNSVQIDEVGKKSGDFYMAIRDALRTWSLIEGADFTLLYQGETTATNTSYDGENEIMFVHKGNNKPLGQAQIWYTPGNVILEVDIWLNDDYQFSVDDDPALNEVDLESVVLHELGHWVPLAHSTNPDAVMYSVLGSMEMKRALHVDDVDAVTQIYPCNLPPCINEVYLTPIPTATPRPLLTATPTFVPTATLIPTTMPTNAVEVYLPVITR